MFLLQFHHSFAKDLDREVLEEVKLQESSLMCDQLLLHHKSAERHCVPVRRTDVGFATLGHRQN